MTCSRWSKGRGMPIATGTAPQGWNFGDPDADGTGVFDDRRAPLQRAAAQWAERQAPQSAARTGGPCPALRARGQCILPTPPAHVRGLRLKPLSSGSRPVVNPVFDRPHLSLDGPSPCLSAKAYVLPILALASSCTRGRLVPAAVPTRLPWLKGVSAGRFKAAAERRAWSRWRTVARPRPRCPGRGG
jgi:hypothetical protein